MNAISGDDKDAGTTKNGASGFASIRRGLWTPSKIRFKWRRHSLIDFTERTAKTSFSIARNSEDVVIGTGNLDLPAFVKLASASATMKSCVVEYKDDVKIRFPR